MCGPDVENDDVSQSCDVEGRKLDLEVRRRDQRSVLVKSRRSNDEDMGCGCLGAAPEMHFCLFPTKQHVDI